MRKRVSPERRAVVPAVTAAGPSALRGADCPICDPSLCADPAEARGSLCRTGMEIGLWAALSRPRPLPSGLAL